MTLWDLEGSGSLIISPRAAGTICYDKPYPSSKVTAMTVPSGLTEVSAPASP